MAIDTDYMLLSLTTTFMLLAQAVYRESIYLVAHKPRSADSMTIKTTMNRIYSLQITKTNFFSEITIV